MASAYPAVMSARVSMATRSTVYFVVAYIVNLLQLAQGDIPDMVAYTGKVFYVSFESHPIFGDRAVNLEWSLASNGHLPSWLMYNSTARSLSGVPLSTDQGWTMLVITTLCKSKHNIDKCLTYSNVFRLSVSKFSWQDFMSQTLKVAKPVLDLSTESLDFRDDALSEDSGCESHKVVASLLLCVSTAELSSQERLDLMNRLSDFLSIPVASITLESSSSSRDLKAVEVGFQMVSAGPGFGENCELSQHTEIIWELPCSAIKQLTDFMHVLQHNVDGGRLQEEIRIPIFGWYVASSNSLLTRESRRKRRRAAHHTILPTPVIEPVVATTVTSSSHLAIPATSSAKLSIHLQQSSSDFVPTSLPAIVVESLTKTQPFLYSSSTTAAAVPSHSPEQSSVLKSHHLPPASMESSSSSSSSLLPLTLVLSVPIIQPSSTETLLLPSIPDVDAFYSSYPTTETSVLLQSFIERSISKLSLTVSMSEELMIPFTFTLSQLSSPMPTPASLYSMSPSVIKPASISFMSLPELDPYTTSYSESVAFVEHDYTGSEASLPLDRVTATSSVTLDIVTTSASPVFDHVTQSLAFDNTTSFSTSQSLQNITVYPQFDIGTTSPIPDNITSSIPDNEKTSPVPDNETRSPVPDEVSASPISDNVTSPDFENVTTTESKSETSSQPFIQSYSSQTLPQSAALPQTSDSVFMEAVTDYVSQEEPSFASTEESRIHSTLTYYDTKDSLYFYTTSTTVEFFSTEILQIESTFESQHTDHGYGSVSEIFSSFGYSTLTSSAAINVTSADVPVFLTSTYSTSLSEIESAIRVDRLSSSDLITHRIQTDFLYETSLEEESTEVIKYVTELQESSSFDTMLFSTAAHDVFYISTVAENITVISSASFTEPTVNVTSESPSSTSMVTSTTEMVTSTTEMVTIKEMVTETGTDLTTTEETTLFQRTTSSRPATCAGVTWAQTTNRDSENEIPFVLNPIGLIQAEQGRQLEFSISQNVFCDKEDGDTSNLTLSVELSSGRKLPSNFWLYLDAGKQVLRGIPLQGDLYAKNISIILIGRDSGGLVVNDTIKVYVNEMSQNLVTHVFIMTFDANYQEFMASRRNIADVVMSIANFFDDKQPQSITVTSVSEGSLKLSWTNNTLSGNVCQIETITKLYAHMVRRDGIVKSSFSRRFDPSLQLLDVQFEPRGACYVAPPSTAMTTTTTLLMSETKGHGLSIWAHVILPVMIAVLVFIFIILIIVFCNRRRRQQQAVINAEKEAVSNDRNPIIFPDELYTDDPSLRTRDPLVLPADLHPPNPEMPNQSPKSTSGSLNQERARRGREHRKQESLARDDEAAEQERDRSHERKQSKERKRQRDDNRMSGVSAGSTLSWDRPNNHYLEEEADSRNSTLKSTKSSSPEKRHPRSPPPYWHSHSDPPPYRLPPTYLTSDNTTQV